MRKNVKKDIFTDLTNFLLNLSAIYTPGSGFNNSNLCGSGTLFFCIPLPFILFVFLSYIDEDDEEVSRILRQPAPSSSPALATASPLAAIKPDLGSAQEEEDIAEAVEDPPADLCVAETLLLLASMTYRVEEPLDGGAGGHIPVRPWADNIHADERTSDEGLSVLCEGIDFLDSLPPCPGLDLLCSITRQGFILSPLLVNKRVGVIDSSR
jgi:hypothetical protein